MSTEDMHFSQMTTFGDHMYRREGQVTEIIMENSRTGVRKTIVDDHGIIMDFPGLAHPELIELYCNGYVGKRIRFRSEISTLGDQYALIWQIQPDGRYWEDDDGFGGTSDVEIDLYARINDAGYFIEPFHICSIGSNRLYGTDAETQLLDTLRMPENPQESLQEHIPGMLDMMKSKIEIPDKGTAVYNVPGTIYQAALTLNMEQDKWYVRASMEKRYSDSYLVGYLKFMPLEEQREYLSSSQAVEDAEKELKVLLYQMMRRE